MKRRKKTSRRAAPLSVWDETLQAPLDSAAPSAEPEETGEFTPGELGQPDESPKPDRGNPAGVQGGRGPLDQEGEGNRQNDELAELEQPSDLEKDNERF